MGKLISSATTSLDGFIEDEDGRFDWAAPFEEVLAFVNNLERPIGTYLCSRRMHETMVGREADEFLGDRRPLMLDFAGIWRAADKVVFSRTFDMASSVRTRIETTFDTERNRQMKASARRDLTIGGAELAALAFRANFDRRMSSVSQSDRRGRWEAGSSGKVPLRLDLLDEERFGNGVVHLRYRVTA